MKLAIKLLAVHLLLLFASSLHGQFQDVSTMLGINNTVATTYNGNGLSFYDFNGDGWDDITMGRGSLPPVFLVNNQGSFNPAPFSIPNFNNRQIMMIMWVDYDSDGDLDLFITKLFGPMELWQNDGNFNFFNVAAAAGIEQQNLYYTGAAWCDYDHDGDLDLYVSKFYHPNINVQPQHASVFYKNNGDGTFSLATNAAGIWLPQRPIFQPVFLDYDNDGWEDLYLITDRVFVENALFRNNHDGTFTNVTLDSGAGLMICAMTGTVGDYDNDGDLDVYVTNGPAGSKLLRNNGNSTFTEVAAQMGVNAMFTGWGSLWIDYNNDSWQDLFVGLTGPHPAYAGNHFYVNNQGTGFTNMIAPLGMLNEINETFVTAMGDINNDGYFDILLNNGEGYLPKLYKNVTTGNNYLSVSLRGTFSNREGIGAWIKCYAGGNHYVRFSLCGENLIGQNPNRYIFGLGDINHIDSLVVHWNRGTVDVLYNLSVNNHITVVEGLSPFLSIQPTASAEYLCPNETIVLTITGYPNAVWNTGDTGETITVTEPGIYYATVMTPLGIATQSMTVEVWASPGEPPQVDVQHERCFGENDGTAMLINDAETWQCIAWSNGAEWNQISGLAPGNYGYLAKDIYGCSYEGEISIQPAEEIVVILFTSNVLCHGDSTGMAMLAAFGGSQPHTIDWGGNLPDALHAGNYTVSVTDAAGCTVVKSFDINEPDAITLTLQLTHIESEGAAGSATALVSGGTPPFTYSWDGMSTTGPTAWSLTPGVHSLTVKDANECTFEVQFEILNTTLVRGNVKFNACIIAPNPVRDRFSILQCNLPDVFSYSIFDATGALKVQQFHHPASQAVDAQSLGPGLYFMRMELPGGLGNTTFVKLED